MWIEETDPACVSPYGCREGLRLACRCGHLRIAMWIYDTMLRPGAKYYSVPLAHDGSDVLCLANTLRCANSNPEIAEWLYRLPGAPEHMAKLLYVSGCKTGNLAMVKWACGKDPTLPSATDAEAAETLDDACQSNHIDVIRWLGPRISEAAWSAVNDRNPELVEVLGVNMHFDMMKLVLSLTGHILDGLAPEDVVETMSRFRKFYAKSLEEGTINSDAFREAERGFRWFLDRFPTTAADLVANADAATAEFMMPYIMDR